MRRHVFVVLFCSTRTRLAVARDKRPSSTTNFVMRPKLPAPHANRYKKLEKKKHMEYMRKPNGWGAFSVGLLFSMIQSIYRLGTNTNLPRFIGRWVPLPKVITDQLFWGPLWNAIYITVTGALKRDSFEAIKEAVTSTAIPLVLSGIKLWPLAHLVTYGL